MDDTAIKESTTTHDIEAMMNEVVNRFTIVVEEKLTAFEQRIETKFVKWNEFEELRNKFNAYPQKPANSSDVEEVFRELDKVKAENNLLKGQVNQAIGGQTELRDSIRNMRETADKVEAQGTRFENIGNLLMGSLENNRETMRGIHAEQQIARQDRETMRKRDEDLATEIRRVEGITEDTEKRYIETYTPLYGFVMGDKTQPGIQKMFIDVKASIEKFEQKYEKDREADKEALNFSLTMKRFIIGSIKSVMKPAVLLRILFAIFGTGTIGAILIQLINGAN